MLCKFFVFLTIISALTFFTTACSEDEKADPAHIPTAGTLTVSVTGLAANTQIISYVFPEGTTMEQAGTIDPLGGGAFYTDSAGTGSGSILNDSDQVIQFDAGNYEMAVFIDTDDDGYSSAGEQASYETIAVDGNTTISLASADFNITL